LRHESATHQVELYTSEALRSEFLAVLQNVFLATISLIDLFGARGSSYDYGMDVTTSENTWAFGQILLLALSILPCLAVFDTVKEARKKLSEPFTETVSPTSTASIDISAPTTSISEHAAGEYSPPQRVTSGRLEAGRTPRKHKSSLLFCVGAWFGIDEAALSSEMFDAAYCKSKLAKMQSCDFLAWYMWAAVYFIYS